MISCASSKGNPVKQYEPYFTDTADWEPDATAAMQGVTPILHYDPLGRLVRTDPLMAPTNASTAPPGRRATSTAL